MYSYYDEVIDLVNYKNSNESSDSSKKSKKSTKNNKKINSKLRNLMESMKKVIKKKNIPVSVINLFYTEPTNFFNNHKELLENTSFYDICGISIFSHYFYVLYEDYKENKNKEEKKMPKEIFDIYNNNFNSFFMEYKDFLLKQDLFLDTPLHKLAKLKDKIFFFKICKRFLELKILNYEILSIENKKEETCFNYIIDNINNLSLIKKNDYIYYKEFIDSFKNKIESFDIKKKEMIMAFNLDLSFDILKFNEYNFNDIYNIIIKLINNNIYNCLISYFNLGINYLNYLFHLCNNEIDYNNLLILINQYFDKKEDLRNYIFQHIGYILLNINSTKRKGEKEINYAINLIKTFLNNGIKNKTKKEIQKIFISPKIIHYEKYTIFFKIGIIYNLIYNSNLSFEKKYEILDIIEQNSNFKIGNEISNQINHIFIDLYRFFKLVKNNNISKSNINDLYKNNEFIKKIFQEFYEYTYFYSHIKSICKNVSNYNNFENFINIVNNYIKEHNPQIINNYKIRHGLRDKQINVIIDFILLYIKNNENDDKILEKYGDIQEKILIKLKTELLESNENLLKTSIKSINKDYIGKSYLFELLFHSKYDLREFIEQNMSSFNLNNSKIEINIKKNFNLINISPFLSQLDKFEYIFDKCKPTDIFENAKKNNTPISSYMFFFYLSDYYNDINILSNKKGNFLVNFRLLIKKNLLYFINDWDKPNDFSEFLNDMVYNILPYIYILAKNSIDTPEENKEKIKALFYILYDLKPESKIELEKFETMIISHPEIYSEKLEYQLIDPKFIYNFYLLLILIYIKTKYGDYNPEILFLFLYFYEGFDNILLIFIKCLKENQNNNIYNHFFMGNFDKKKSNIIYIKNLINFVQINYEKSKYYFFEQILFFFDNYLSNLNEIKNSLVFKYIINILTNNGQYELEREFLIPSILLNMGHNQKIKNIILQKIFSSEISFYIFMNVSYNHKNEKKYRNIIYNIDKIAKNSLLKSFFIYPNINNNFLIARRDTILNMYQLFQSLKKKSITLYEYINSNFALIKDTIFFLSFIQLNYEYNISILKNKEKMDILNEELYDFLLSAFYFCKNTDNYSKLISIKHEIKSFLIIETFLEIFYKKIKKINNKNSLNIEFDKFIEFIKFYFNTNDKTEQEKKIVLNGQFIKQILYFLFEKNIEKYIEFAKFLMFNFQKNFNLRLIYYDLLINIVCKDLDKYEPYFDGLLSLIKDYLNLHSRFVINKKNFILSYLLRNTKYKDEVDIFKNNLDENNINKIKSICLGLLNDIKDKDKLDFLLSKVKNVIFEKEEDLLLWILDNGVKNEYIIDYLLNSLSKEKQKLFYEKNKEKIEKSLFLYAQRNEYINIQKLLKFINKFISINEISKKIFAPKQLDGDGESKEILKELKEKDKDDEDEFFKSDEKYLFSYCLSKRMNLNYEIIALLFEYFPKEKITNLFPFLINNLEKIIYDEKIRTYMLYFRNEKNGIKNRIKKLSPSFYHFSSFLEIFIDKFNFLKENNFERILFLYFIKIYILETIPEELLIFFDFEIQKEEYDKETYDKWFINILKSRKKKRNIVEKNIFIIFSYFELKGLTIIPIKKYLPYFYYKIESYLKKFNNMNIPSFCIKTPFDVKIYENLKNIISNKTNQLLEYLYNNYSLNNLMFIIEKEKNIILDLSKEYIYLEKLIYNLIENKNIESQIEDDKYEYYMTSLKEYFGNLKSPSEGDDINKLQEMENILIKKVIFTLKNFNSNALILIEKCFQNKEYKNKYNYLIEFKAYLRIISNICIHIILNTKNNKENVKNDTFFSYKIDLYSEFEKHNDKFKILINTIDINAINYLILKKYEEKNINDNKEYFNVIKNFIKDFCESKDVSTKYSDMKNGEFTYLTYFEYLKFTCFILIKFLNEIEEMDYIKLKKRSFNNMKIENISFVFEKDKNKGKKIFENSFYNLGNEILEKIEEIGFKNIFSKNEINYKISFIFGYYFNEEKKDYVETYTDIILIDFVKIKIFSIFNFFKSLYLSKIDLKFVNKISDITTYLMPYKCNYNEINDLLKLFHIEDNNNLLLSYLKDNAYYLIIPNIEYFESPLYLYFDRLYFAYIYPVIDFNQNLYNKFFNKKKGYENIIDFKELIKAIKETKFHKNNNLNEFFQIKAINYIINNNDSFIFNFIDILYGILQNKIDLTSTQELIKKKYKIKVNKGFTYDSININEILDKLPKTKNIENDKKENINKSEKKDKDKEKVISANELNNPEIKKKKLKLKINLTDKNNKEILPEKNNDNNNSNIGNENETIIIKNYYKRKNIPLSNYCGYIPRWKSVSGLTKESHIENIFGNEIIIEKNIGINKIDLLDKEKKSYYIKEKPKIVKNENIINIFNLIFKVEKLENDEIIINQYDISKILEPYSEEEKFLNLVNRCSYDKTEIIIPEYWNNSILKSLNNKDSNNPKDV